MAYHVKEIYYTLQGEGLHAGRAAVFCRFSGCNLWNGIQEHKAKASCWFCDTDFVGTDGPQGGKYESPDSLVSVLSELWPSGEGEPMVVFTGGEPLLQLDSELLLLARERGFFTAVETNGTIVAPEGLDWITVSPKPNSELVQRKGNELKLVFPHDVQPENLTSLDFDHYYLSPLTSTDTEETASNTRRAIEYCRTHPQWKLTLQYHKLWGIP